MLVRHAIGTVLRRRRLERGRTLRTLADESRVSLPYLSEIERGRKEASSEILANVCRVLDVTPGELLREASTELSRASAPVIDISSALGSSALDRQTAAEQAVSNRTELLLAA